MLQGLEVVVVYFQASSIIRKTVGSLVSTCVYFQATAIIGKTFSGLVSTGVYFQAPSIIGKTVGGLVSTGVYFRASVIIEKIVSGLVSTGINISILANLYFCIQFITDAFVDLPFKRISSFVDTLSWRLLVGVVDKAIHN